MSNKCEKCVFNGCDKNKPPCTTCIDNPTLHPTESAFIQTPTPSCRICSNGNPKGKPCSIACVRCMHNPDKDKTTNQFKLSIGCMTCIHSTKDGNPKNGQPCIDCRHGARHTFGLKWQPAT